MNEARVSPVHKGDKNNIADNFRPISILPVVAKIFARIIYINLFSYLIKNGTLTNGVLPLDLSKAFDTVDHSVLLQKLSIYSVCGNALNLLKSYLHNRTQCCVIVNKTLSELFWATL